MENTKIRKSVSFKASKEKLWEVLQQDKYTRAWYAAFYEGAHAVTDWKLGSKVIFKDPEGNGMIGRIAESRPGELLTVEYTGLLDKNREDYESQVARLVKGGKEIYRLAEKDGVTRLDVEADMSPDMYEDMSRAWDKALAKMKELAEAK